MTGPQQSPPNQPDPTWTLVQTLQQTVTTLNGTVGTLSGTISDLKRIVEGDAAMGVPSLREAMRKHEEVQSKRMDDLEAAHTKQVDELETRLDKLEEEKKLADTRLNTVWNIVKWAGGGSLAGVVLLIIQLSHGFGGGK